MTTELDQLKHFSVVVADTGDFSAVAEYAPEDATTNPSLILNAAKSGKFTNIIENCVKNLKPGFSDKNLADIADELAIEFGAELLKVVPGKVSTEVDACLSFDTVATIEKARKLIAAYERRGISRERVLIKIAGTWEGCQAAKVLESEGIHCNITLIFTLAQAIAAAEAGAFLISPFVGRILDWYKKFAPDRVGNSIHEHPGVVSVRNIHNYYKKFGYSTIVMAASFRSKAEIEALAGCDRMTIAPKFLQELQNSPSELLPERILSSGLCTDENCKKISMDEKTFRWMLNEDAMATEKLSEGIRAFHKDYCSLLEYVQEFVNRA